MGPLLSSAAGLLLTSLLALLLGASSVPGQELRETDALCNADGCFAVYFQRKTFLDSWRACKDKGGNLATVKHTEDANTIQTLFSTLDLRHSRTKVQVWIGLQRQPRQCTSTRPLRGFSWTTGDHDTEYTNWQREYSPNMCSVSRCVVMGFNTQEQSDNFKWLDGSCSVPVDGYLCHYAFKGMCPPLWGEGAGDALYTTPFNLLSTLLTHVPFGSVAAVPCPAGGQQEQSVLCLQKEDGSVGWSRDPPVCSEPPAPHNWCDEDNGGCEHFCKLTRDDFYCECADGYQLGNDGQTCELSDFCKGALCEFECLPVSDGHRCACPEGYMLAPDEHGCLDVDECLQSPCEQHCVNAPGSFECLCKDGYQHDEEGECEDVDECVNDPCEHACENTEGSHVCHCHLGYSPVPEDPSQCQDTDECQVLGTCEQMCVNYEGGFVCYCEEGYELMSDDYSCRKVDDPSAVTPPFSWVTHRSGPVWDPEDYDYDPEQSHTDWPPDVQQPLNWLTDPPKAFDPSVIWVTSVPKEEPVYDALEPPTPETETDGTVTVDGGAELEVLSTAASSTSPLTTSTNTHWYEDEEGDTTTAAPFLSTSTISEGAWNWWAGISTTHNILTDSTSQEEKPSPGDSVRFSEEDIRVEEGDYVEITYSQDSADLSQPTPSQPAPSEGRGSRDSEEEEQQQSSTSLLVGLLVPICIFIVVMVALGIVYCTRCAVQPRSKNTTDCYHWISGAHDKQGAANPPAGGKTHV